MSKKEKRKDERYEGREKYELDVDRYINEGLAGGTVASMDDRTQIEEARDLPKENEEFPYKRD
ncbi:hypothetical protein [Aquibacillus albus]|uniref:DUF4025 domain-containing protein n=1 Tax=Aquibacillus albus TaxID=1168171 RepID=A0ABS2MZZ7_9BACI|nr:hypothetical protein [Aquibacillus albus]MBM7571437.1 hypothetical protein [Aquibacillus albus]